MYADLDTPKNLDIPEQEEAPCTDEDFERS
jgi:hypothetical protein